MDASSLATWNNIWGIIAGVIAFIGFVVGITRWLFQRWKIPESQLQADNISRNDAVAHTSPSMTAWLLSACAIGLVVVAASYVTFEAATRSIPAEYQRLRSVAQRVGWQFDWDFKYCRKNRPDQFFMPGDENVWELELRRNHVIALYPLFDEVDAAIRSRAHAVRGWDFPPSKVIRVRGDVCTKVITEVSLDNENGLSTFDPLMGHEESIEWASKLANRVEVFLNDESVLPKL